MLLLAGVVERAGAVDEEDVDAGWSMAQRFGTASLGRALGLTNLLMLPMSAAAGPMAAAVHDATGSYRTAPLGFVVACAPAIFSLFAAGRWLSPDGTARENRGGVPASRPRRGRPKSVDGERLGSSIELNC